MLNIVHVTHEAVQKIGGIGTVLEGLTTARYYQAAVDRTILLAPLFTTQGGVDSRLGPGGEVQYSSLDGRTHHPLAAAFHDIQARFHVHVVYGRRLIRDPLTGAECRPEVILIDVNHVAPGPLNGFKSRLFQSFGIASDRYEQSWEFEQYVRLAEPGLAAVRAVGAVSGQAECVVVSHEFMGMPTALAAKLDGDKRLKTVFYAHEVAPVRRIVEEHPGHDTMFYNVLRKAREQNLHIGDVFGDQTWYFKHALVEASRHLDVTLAVGDYVVEELRFLSPAMAHSNIRLAYNGIPAHRIDPAAASVSKRRLQDYAATLLGDRPDYVFTHVTRLVHSKGLWRDLHVMDYIDEQFRRENKTCVLFVLSTEIGGPRRREDILNMERWWDWPVAHREGLPDLTAGEALYYAGVQKFNARARNCKIVYINQFGFDRATCGDRMPEQMEFWDIRRGSDVEFGQSIYEPFGIAQLEALSFGAICVMTNVCGCAGFVQKVAPQGTPNVVIADYTHIIPNGDTIESFMRMTREQRSKVCETVARTVATHILDRLPDTPEEKTAYLDRGYELAHQMSWDAIARDYFLPAVCATKSGDTPDAAAAKRAGELARPAVHA